MNGSRCINVEPGLKGSRYVGPNQRGPLSDKPLQNAAENQDFKIREIKKVLLQNRASVLA